MSDDAEQAGQPMSAEMLRRVVAHGAKLAADEEWLPFAPQSLDAVVSALTLHWANDLPGVLVQLRHALKPDGLLLAAMIGGDSLKELRQAMAAAASQQDDGLAPRIAPMVDIRDAGALLQRAGFALPVADSEIIHVTYAHALELMRDLRGMGETNMLLQRPRHFTGRRRLMAIAEAYQHLYAGADGRIPATFELITLTGWAPPVSVA